MLKFVPMDVERRLSSKAELSTFEQQLLQRQLTEHLNYVWAGPHDRKFFPINEQISMEERYIRASLYFLKRDSGSFRRRKPIDQSSPIILIASAVRRAEDRSNRRLKQLRHAWYKEDSRMRQETGASWGDLCEVLTTLDIKQVDPNKLRRPHRRSIFTEREDPSWGLSDRYIFTSESKKPKKVWGSSEIIDAPSHVVEVFGNETLFSEEDFQTIVERLGLESKVVYQISESLIDSVTYLPVFKYRVVVPYKNWLLVSNEWIYDRKPLDRKDKKQQFTYWSQSFLPEVLVKSNRGQDLISDAELELLGIIMDTYNPEGPIH